MTLIDEDRAHELYAAMGPGVEISGGSARQHDRRARVASAPAPRTSARCATTSSAKCSRTTSARPVSRSNAAAHRRARDGSLPDRRHARRRAHDEHVPRCVGVSSVPTTSTPTSSRRAKVVYLEGYLWDRPEAKEAYRKAARIAHEAGNEVSLTLSDSFCVDRHRAEWLQPRRGRGRHAVRERRPRSAALYECDFDDAMEAVRRDCRVAALDPLRPRVR